MNPTKKQARIAGLWYLLLGVTAPIGLVYVPGKIIVPGNAAATIDRLRASASLLRIGIASELFHQIIGIFLVLALYRLFKAVNEKYAVLMVIFSLLPVPIMFLNVLNEIAAIVLVSGADFLSAFEKHQLDAWAYLFLRLHGQGISVASIFWGLWLFSVWDSYHSIGFHPPLFGRLAVHCRFRLSGRFLYHPGADAVRTLCWQVRDDSYGCRIADNVLAFDLGCEDETIRRARLLIELLPGGPCVQGALPSPLPRRLADHQRLLQSVHDLRFTVFSRSLTSFPALLGEMAFMLWLVIKGVKVQPSAGPRLLIERLFVASSCFDIMSPMQSELTEQAKKLSISDRILLVEEICDTIAGDNQAFELTDAQKRELDRRLESARSNPEQGRTWDEIKAEFMKSR